MPSKRSKRGAIEKSEGLVKDWDAIPLPAKHSILNQLLIFDWYQLRLVSRSWREAVDLEISHLGAGNCLPKRLSPRYASLKILDLASCAPTAVGEDLVVALLQLPSLGALLNVNTLGFMRRLRKHTSATELSQRASLASRLTSLSFGPQLDPGHRNVTKDLAGIVEEWGSIATLRIPFRLSRFQDLDALFRPLRASLRCLDIETCCGSSQAVKALDGLDLDLKELLIEDLSSAWNDTFLDYRPLAKMTNLLRLSLRCLQVTEIGLDHLSGLTGLTRLDLCSPRITGLAIVQACSLMTRVEWLDIGCCTMTAPAEFQAVLRLFPNLQDLTNSPMGLAPEMQLDKYPGLTSLRAMYCSTMAELKDMGPLTSLRRLEMECCGHHNGIKELSVCTRLTYLSLPNRSGSLNDSDIAHITALTGLRFLSLAGNRSLTGAGIAMLAALPLLSLLELSYLDPSILVALKELQNLPHLQWICLASLGTLSPKFYPQRIDPSNNNWVTDKMVEDALPARMRLAYKRAHPARYGSTIGPPPDLVYRLCVPAGENPKRSPW